MSLQVPAESRTMAAASGIPVFVMLPLDILDDNHEVKYGQGPANAQEVALSVDLLKLVKVGVKGVMVDCWWGRVEAGNQGEYRWEGYKNLFKIVSDTSLDLHVVMSFHACEDEVQIPLPNWVTNIGNRNSDIFYKDGDGYPDREYLSLGVDDLPLGDVPTTIKVYEKFMEQFKTEMKAYFGEPQEGETTKKGKITMIEVGLGPSGELRYPGYRRDRGWTIGPPAGIGQFQCYDQNMMQKWDNIATNQGFTIPCRVGPQTAGDYNSTPWQTQFFQGGAGLTNGISYTETYGETFLTWYSDYLVDHGRKVLEIADQIFNPVKIAAKVPGIYWYCGSQSRAAEATAGLSKGGTNSLSVYRSIAEILNNLGATFIFTCVEREDVAGNNNDRPQLLVQEVLGQAQPDGASIACENGSQFNDDVTCNRIIGVAVRYNISYFTYMRFGPDLVTNPADFGRFQRFVKGMNDRTYI